MLISIERQDHVAIVRVNNPPVNALSAALRRALLDAVFELDADDTIEQAILICEGRTFIAGADISEFGKPPLEPHLPDVILAIEAASTQWIAAIHGTSLGGGFEVALGCQYRIMAQSAKVGLPEVTLGLIPGAGGTIRLTRLIDTNTAIDMITSGRPITAAQASAAEICARIIEGDLLQGALNFAADIRDTPKPPPLKARTIDQKTLPADYWDKARATISKSAKGAQAPLRALESIKNAIDLPFEEALARERQIFLECREGVESSALRHMFFAEKSAVKPNWLTVKPLCEITNVAVIGGGTMGAGICAALQLSGYSVTLVERDQESLTRGVSNIRKIYEGSVKRGKLSLDDMDRHQTTLAQHVGYAGLGEVDLIIEAVFEDLDVKRSLFKQLNDICKPDAIFATNTSYLNPNMFGETLTRPENLVGIHFFSPAHIMKLVEIIKTDKTSDDTITAAFALAKKMRKIPVLAGVCDGFIGNRILKTYRQQAERLLLEGAMPSDMDLAMRDFGMAMGPFEAQDLGGLDIAFAQRQNTLATGASVYAPIADKLCAIKRFGQKTSGGWYDYEAGNRKPIPSDAVAEIIRTERQNINKQARQFESEEIQKRILYPMINEALLILEEGIAKHPVDIDLVEVLGFGFPRWRGGLLHYADQIGLAKIHADLSHQQNQEGGNGPCDYLAQLVRDGAKLADLNEI